jgi:hypothetical protein
VRVEILYVADCPHRDEAERHVRRILAELERDAEVISVRVGDAAEARRLAFVGSPTIRVNGADVVPAPQDTPAALACRIYRTAGGTAGVPDPAAIRAAVERGFR